MKKMLIIILVNLISLSTASASQFVEKAVFDLGFKVKLYMIAKPFNPTKHSIKYCKPVFPRDDWEGVSLIDGKPIFGTDWETPKYVLKEAYVKLNGKKIKLDVSCMYNPWFGEPDKKFFSAKKMEGSFIIEGNFSDGAGSYKVRWKIIEGTSIRIAIEDGEC